MSNRLCDSLAVPGLAEKRPSLIVGDSILVQHVNSRSHHWWEGRVFRVRQLEVDLKFNGRFNAFRGQRFDVRFRLNRLCLRRMHQALDSTFSRGSVLFPRIEDFDYAKRPSSAQLAAIRPGERKIAENEHQLEAVAAIMHQAPGSPPFIVFGPYVTSLFNVDSLNSLQSRDRQDDHDCRGNAATDPHATELLYPGMRS